MVPPGPPPDLPGAATGSVSQPDAAPVVAPSQAPASAAPVAAQPAAASSGLDTGARRAIALAVIALEVLGYAWLQRARDPALAPAAAGAVTAASGGRLRPPDRATTRGATPALGGVGRFRQERRGAAPHL